MGPRTRLAEPVGSGGVLTLDRASVVPVRHRGQRVLAVAVAVLGALAGWSLWINPAVERSVVARYLFSGTVLRGVGVTVQLTVIGMLLGVAVGITLALMRLSHNRILTSIAWGFAWFFRGTPLVVQLVFWGYLGALYPRLSFGIPGQSALQVYLGTTNALVGPLVAAMLGLGLNEGAYASEIVRAGILAVEPGQTEAAKSLGMTKGQTMRRIVLPQAMRVIIPPMGNETITMLKSTGLVFVIGGSADLFATAQSIYGQTYQTIPLLIVASLWYLALTSVLSVVQYFLERRFSRGQRSRHTGRQRAGGARARWRRRRGAGPVVGENAP